MKNFLAILLASILGFGVATGIGFGIKYRHDIKDTVVSWFDKDTKEETNEDVDLPEQEVVNYEELYNLEKINNINLQNELNKYKGLEIDIKEELTSFVYSYNGQEVDITDTATFIYCDAETFKKLLNPNECLINEFYTGCTYTFKTLDAIEECSCRMSTEIYSDLECPERYTINFNYILNQTAENDVDLDTWDELTYVRTIEDITEDFSYCFKIRNTEKSVDYYTKEITINLDILYTIVP
ncbi:MAG: hypothetical protein J6C97_01140 [Clostridia bacterium]|nr:hypothetical protein [Clostridia bacterium]